MKLDEILEKLETESITVSIALQELCEIGYCPNVLNDDDGRWAVSFGGFQNVVMGDVAEDINTSFFIEAKFWKPSILEAFIFALRV